MKKFFPPIFFPLLKTQKMERLLRLRIKTLKEKRLTGQKWRKKQNKKISHFDSLIPKIFLMIKIGFKFWDSRRNKKIKFYKIISVFFFFHKIVKKTLTVKILIVHEFSDSLTETFPFFNFSAHREIIQQRLQSLSHSLSLPFPINHLKSSLITD